MPTIPPRSRLHHLEPVGIGTSEVESLTSFIIRLAAAHRVSVGALYKHEFEPRLRKLKAGKGTTIPKRMLVKSIYPNALILNGLSSTAAWGAKALEDLTLRPNLNFLTCIPWGTAISANLLLRKSPAWCPVCYDEWKKTGSIIRSPLLWVMNAVTVCVKHERPLTELCPHCNRPTHFLAGNSLSGHCSRCQLWLGHNNGDIKFVPATQEEIHYSLWAAKTVGDWIETAQRLPTPPKAEDTTRILIECIKRLAEGKGKAFARLVGVETAVVYMWQSGKNIPRLEHLLKISSTLGVSLADLLTGRLFSDESNLITKLNQLILRNLAKSTHDTDKVRQAISEMLEENPAPSLQEVAERLGYGGADSIRQTYPDLSKQIMMRYKLSERGKQAVTFQKLCDDKTVLRKMEEALKQECPPSPHKIAASLSYKSSKSLLEKFPELYRQIVNQRTAHRKKHLPNLKHALKTVLKEMPPPSLRRILKRLGNLHPRKVRDPFPELCRAIIDRHAEWEKTRAVRVAAHLQTALEEETPRPLTDVAREQGYFVSDLRKRHPELCRLIVERFAKHQRKCTEEKRQLVRAEVRRVALDLHKQGMHPSEDRVKPLLRNVSITNLVLISTTLRELRRELGLPDRDRRSLACT